MIYELNGRKNICVIGNVITLQNNSKKRNSGKKQLAQRAQSFQKARSWKFEAILNAPLFYKCCLTSRVTLRYL